MDILNSAQFPPYFILRVIPFTKQGFKIICLYSVPKGTSENKMLVWDKKYRYSFLSNRGHWDNYMLKSTESWSDKRKAKPYIIRHKKSKKCF